MCHKKKMHIMILFVNVLFFFVFTSRVSLACIFFALFMSSTHHIFIHSQLRVEILIILWFLKKCFFTCYMKLEKIQQRCRTWGSDEFFNCRRLRKCFEAGKKKTKIFNRNCKQIKFSKFSCMFLNANIFF